MIDAMIKAMHELNHKDYLINEEYARGQIELIATLTFTGFGDIDMDSHKEMIWDTFYCGR